MQLANKNAVIYGGGGAIGGAIAQAFTQAGATVHLVGRTRDTLDRTAAAIGGGTTVAVLDALDEAAVDAHAASLVESAGSLDISLNLIARGDVQGIPLAEMSVDDLMRATTVGVSSVFITARAAARHMIAQKSGVILALNSGSAHSSPMLGSTGPADAATDTLIRNLAMELGPSGIRVLGMWVAGVPETLTLEKLNAVNSNMQLDEAALQGLLAQLASMRMLRRSPTLADIATTATFLASDRAAGITATFVNVTGGIFAS
jgi:NAD(P)-dependent dehydrogenase (short-subunit alcohol dehydrogenase family)